MSCQEREDHSHHHHHRNPQLCKAKPETFQLSSHEHKLYVLGNEAEEGERERKRKRRKLFQCLKLEIQVKKKQNQILSSGVLDFHEKMKFQKEKREKEGDICLGS
ncbi:hypothetical protein MANES_04G137850v8 [Manihot esculenta]|uniref:Uncharacterized protein n=1 Tax=Manihot esculenta TaxID=3983 RepID=A0ACB7HXC8_MANES|nr:hypothetical protein MANES_04G137850v8 [Manihot esculenta]